MFAAHHKILQFAASEPDGVAREVRARSRAPLGIVIVGPHDPRQTNTACRRARNRQGHVAARWPTATLDRPSTRRPIKVRSAPRDSRQLVEQGDGKGRRLA